VYRLERAMHGYLRRRYRLAVSDPKPSHSVTGRTM
jgi:hypothetical protein